MTKPVDTISIAAAAIDVGVPKAHVTSEALAGISESDDDDLRFIHRRNFEAELALEYIAGGEE